MPRKKVSSDERQRFLCSAKENISTKGPLNRRSLGSPGFPVESCGFGQMRVVLFTENHMRGRR